MLFRNPVEKDEKNQFVQGLTKLQKRVVIVLALLVLAALVIAFTTGFGKFWATIKGYFQSDISNIKQVCEVNCVSGNFYDFCCLERETDFGEGKEKITCQDERLNIKCEINCEGIC